MKKINPAGPQFKHHTNAGVLKAAASGKIDPREADVLRDQDSDIQARVQWNRDHDKDPLGDPVLARMQVANRKAALVFANAGPVNRTLTSSES